MLRLIGWLASRRARLAVLSASMAGTLAVASAGVAAQTGDAVIDAWFLMPVAWGVVALVGVALGVRRHGLPSRDRAPLRSSGDLKRDLTALAGRLRAGDRAPGWLRSTTAMATIAMSITGAVLGWTTREIFWDLPLSWWLIGMAALTGGGLAELARARRGDPGSG